MAQAKASSEWFVKDGDGTRRPFSEAELRQIVGQSSDPQLQVKQGNSAWHPAAVIRQKMDQLAARGIYIRCGKVAEGPFTISKARELLGTVSSEGITVRSGERGQWMPARRWLDAIQKLERKRQGKSQAPAPSQSPATTTSSVPKANEEVLDAVAVDEEIVEAVLVEPATVVQAIPIAIAVSPGHGLPPSQPMHHSQLPANPFVSTPAYVSRIPAGPRPNNPNARRSRGTGGMLLKVGSVALTVFMVVGFVGLKLLKVGGKAALRQQQAAERERQQHLGPDGSRGFIASSPGEPSGVQYEPTSSRTAATRFAPATPSRPIRSGPPTVTPGMLFRPQFVTLDGTVDAGTAFAAKIEGSQPTFIVSALHLFGEAGGLNHDIPAAVLSSRWQGLSLEDCSSHIVHTNVPMQPVPLIMAKPMPNRSAHGDVAVCQLQQAGSLQLQPFPIAREVPAAGERVWLVSEVIGSSSLIHPATIEGTEDGWLIYRFDRRIELRATSGAPVVDGQGQVVAVNAGGGEQAGQTFGVGTPTTNFASSLANRR